MEKPKKSGPSFWISPEENIFEVPMIKLISKLSHRRCNSGQLSPFTEKAVVKVKSSKKIKTRNQSPKVIKPKAIATCVNHSRKSLPKQAVKKALKPKKKKKEPLISLNPLEGKQRMKAPKLFENQIFRDIYDEEGNHDRIMETIDISQSLPEIVNESQLGTGSLLGGPKDIDEYLKQYDETEYKLRIKQPENSFLQETEDYIRIDKEDLLSRLQKLAREGTASEEG